MQAVSASCKSIGRKRLSSSCSLSGDLEGAENRPKTGSGACNLAADCEKYLQAHGMHALLHQSHMGPLGPPFW